jgi:hypothetical protein
VQALWKRWWLPPNLGHGESCEFVYACDSSVHQKCSNHALTNLLFGLYRFVWIIDLLVIHHSSHPEALACPSTLEVLWARKRTLIPFVISNFGFAFESFKECGGALVVVIMQFLPLLQYLWTICFRWAPLVKKILLWSCLIISKNNCQWNTWNAIPS